MMQYHARRALTITELLVVVALILILAMLLVVGGDHAHSAAVQLQCQHHLEQIGQACSVYVTQHQGLWPRSYDTASARQWYWLLAPRYVADKTVLNCPATDAQLTEPRPDLANMTRQDKVELAVLKALRWLKSKQLQNGRWPICRDATTAGEANPAVWTTALDAFLRFKCTTEEPPEFAATVNAGLGATVAWACTETLTSYSNYVASLGTGLAALAHAYKTMGNRTYRVGAQTHSVLNAAQKLIAQIGLDHWPQHGGSHYTGPGHGVESNMATGGWRIYGIAEAKDAGVPNSLVGFDVALDMTKKYLDVGTIIANRYKCNSPSCRRCVRGTKCDKCGRVSGSGSVNRVCGATLSGGAKCTGTFRPCDGKTTTGLVKCPECGNDLVPWVGDESELVGGNCPICQNTQAGVSKVPDEYRTPEYPKPLYSEIDGWGCQGIGNWYHWGSMALATRLTLGGEYNPESGSGYSRGQNTQKQLDKFLVDSGIRDSWGRPNNALNVYTRAFRTDWEIWTIYHATIVMKKLDKLGRGSWWTTWKDGTPNYVDVLLTGQRGDGSWPRDRLVTAEQGEDGAGDVMTTALACMALMECLDGWQDIEELSTDGRCTYGYNNQIGFDRRTPSADTIVVMDYENWEIDRNGQLIDDPPEYVAPRHGGRVNVLFTDGRVETIAPETVRNGMFTVQSGD